MRAQKAGSAGTSLIDVLVAVVILLGAVLWLLYADFLAQRAMQDVHVNTLITKGIVEYTLETARDQSFDAIAALTGASPFPIDPSFCPMMDPTVSPRVVGAVTQAQITVTWADPPTNANLVEFTVSVNWMDSSGHIRNNSASTQISRGGLTNL